MDMMLGENEYAVRGGNMVRTEVLRAVWILASQRRIRMSSEMRLIASETLNLPPSL